MAKIERSINEDFDQLLSNIENGILNSSISATLEDASDFQSGTARCSVRIFERYSYAGGMITKECKWLISVDGYENSTNC